MRLSDILKRAKEQSVQHSGSQREQSISVVQETQYQKKEEVTTSIPPSEIQIPFIHESPNETYTKAIVEIKDIFDRIERNQAVSLNLLSIGLILNLIQNKNEDIIVLADKATPDIYIYGHSVNVCILSVLIGHSLGFEQNTLINLGLCAFLHDVGMARNLNLAQKNSKLTPSEFTQIKKHPTQGQELVYSFNNITDELKALIISVISQIHERKNGSGYPNGLKGNEIHEFARIISIADFYEALTHPRGYRDRVLPHEALKQMVTTTEQNFQPEFIKAFIERISLYPPGSYVRLNTSEIAKVIGINRGLPTRPKVKVIIDACLIKLPQPRLLDLSATPMFFIQEAIDETKLNPSDKKLALELKAVRWWVKGL